MSGVQAPADNPTPLPTAKADTKETILRKKNYVLVKSYYGLGGDLCVLLGAMHFAESTNRDLVVDWSGGLYGRCESGNLFNEFFARPLVGKPSDRLTEPNSVFPIEWFGRTALPPRTFLEGVDLKSSRPEDVPENCDANCVVITRDPKHINPAELYGLASSFRLQPALRYQVELNEQKLESRKYSIGVHYRHGNGETNVICPDIRWYLTRITRRIRTIGLEPSDLILYVSTDSAAALAYFKRHFQNVAEFPKTYRPNGEGAFHVGNHGLSAAKRKQLGEEALIDMYTLSLCDYFIGSSGYFSLFSYILRGGRNAIRNRDERTYRAGSSAPVDLAASDPVFGPVLKRHDFSTDGLFVNQDIEGRHLHYYYDRLFTARSSAASLANGDSLTMRKAIVARRLY